MMRLIPVLLTTALMLSSVADVYGQDFLGKVQPMLEESCLQCHDGSEENGLNFQALGTDLSKPANFRKWVKVFDRVEKGEMPPAGEARPEPEIAAALSAIKSALVAENDRAKSVQGRVVLRRLTRTEYQHTLNDLLSVNAEVAEMIPEENASIGFDTVASTQGFSASHAKAYLEAASQALDTAIRLGPKPESKVRRYNYLESKLIRKHLSKDDHPIIGELDNAAVLFSNASYIQKLEEHVPATGWYKLRAKAWGYRTEKPVVLTLNVGQYDRGLQKMLGFFDLKDDEPRVVEVIAHLKRNQYLFPGVEDLESHDGKNIWSVGPDKYKGSGVAIEWVELEGPLVDEWPPFSTTNLLKDIELEEHDKNRWDPRLKSTLSFQ